MDLPPLEVNIKAPKKIVEVMTTSNPLLTQEGSIQFDAIKPHHFYPAFEAMRENVEAKLQALEKDSRLSWGSMMLTLESIEEEIHRTIGPMVHLKMVMDSPDLRAAWAAIEPLYTKLCLRISQSASLYKAFEAIKESQEWKTLPSVKRRMLEKRLTAANLSGIGLEGKKRERFNELVFKLGELQIAYNANLLDAIKNFSLIIKDKTLFAGLPQHVLQMASDLYNSKKEDKDPLSTPDKGPWRLALTSPFLTPVLRYSENRELRETLYRAEVSKASQGMYDNRENILKQLELRKEMAELLKLSSFAEFSLKKKMAPDVKTVSSFLYDLRSASHEVGKKDFEEVNAFAKASGFKEPLMPWDYSFWAEKLKSSKFNLSAEEVKNYFPFPKVLEGLFNLTQSLFGVVIEKASSALPVWHSDVAAFIVRDEKSGKEIASFYLDPYSRPETKRGGAWMDTCQSRFTHGDHTQNPIAYIVCNLTPPIDSKPALLNFREVETLFHEFGHALQHMLTEVDYASVSGTNGIEWDSVEMASQFMENWCYHPATLKKITAHYLTGTPIPDEMISRLVAARNFQAGMNMLRQLQLGITDFVLHSEYNPHGKISPSDVWHEVSSSCSPLPRIKEDHFLCSFHHIFGDNEYAAGYYSYKWAEVMSADAFEAFAEAGLDNVLALREVGERFRKTFLSLGGSVHPLEVFKAFRGREPSIQPLLYQNGFIQGN